MNRISGSLTDSLEPFIQVSSWGGGGGGLGAFVALALASGERCVHCDGSPFHGFGSGEHGDRFTLFLIVIAPVGALGLLF
jgi:hypothetical protein